MEERKRSSPFGPLMGCNSSLHSRCVASGPQGPASIERAGTCSLMATPSGQPESEVGRGPTESIPRPGRPSRGAAAERSAPHALLDNVTGSHRSADAGQDRMSLGEVSLAAMEPPVASRAFGRLVSGVARAHGGKGRMSLREIPSVGWGADEPGARGLRRQRERSAERQSDGEDAGAEASLC